MIKLSDIRTIEHEHLVFCKGKSVGYAFRVDGGWRGMTLTQEISTLPYKTPKRAGKALAEYLEGLEKPGPSNYIPS